MMVGFFLLEESLLKANDLLSHHTLTRTYSQECRKY